MFKVEFNTDNAAFDEYGEFRRIMGQIADQIEMGITENNIYDVNGNKVGEWKLE